MNSLLIVCCEKCGAPDIEFLGILKGVETWKCKNCGHKEEYPNEENPTYDPFLQNPIKARAFL